jgi:hypothetical protein
VIEDLVHEPAKQASTAPRASRHDERPRSGPRVAREFFASLRTGRSAVAPLRKQ